MPLRLPPQIRIVRTRLRPTVAAEPAPRSFPRAAPPSWPLCLPYGSRPVCRSLKLAST